MTKQADIPNWDWDPGAIKATQCWVLISWISLVGAPCVGHQNR